MYICIQVHTVYTGCTVSNFFRNLNDRRMQKFFPRQLTGRIRWFKHDFINSAMIWLTCCINYRACNIIWIQSLDVFTDFIIFTGLKNEIKPMSIDCSVVKTTS